MICKDCQLLITDFVICKDRGKERIRTRCRPCWNKYSRKIQEKYSDYYKEYLKKYIKERRKTDSDFAKSNNKHNLKSNLKAQAELKDSYIKNRIAKGKKFVYTKEMIEIKRAQIQLSREIKRLGLK